MMIDITLPVTSEMLGTAWENTAKSLVGHIGTHFDVMDKEFPLEYTARAGIVFDVSHVRGRDIETGDIDLSQIRENMFVAFYTGYIEEAAYGTPQYFREHPQFSHTLITALLDRHISIIGIDCAGIRRTPEHVPADQRCADHGVFVVENLWALKDVLTVNKEFSARTFPVRYTGMTGLPCRVVAQLD